MASASSSSEENSIDGLVKRVLAESRPSAPPISTRILESQVGRILDSTGLSEISSTWGPAQKSLIGAATSAAATGMAEWLGNTKAFGRKRLTHNDLNGQTIEYTPHEKSRYLITPGAEADECVVLILDPSVAYSESRSVTPTFGPDLKEMIEVLGRLHDDAARSPASERSEQADVLASLPPDMAAILTEEVRPEIIATSMPRMVPICAPRPHVAITFGAELSTAGVYCRDSDGRFGITACYHGTGPTGTEVEVGLRTYKVDLADPVQDIVFIPLGDDYNIRELCGANGLVTDRAPGQQERATFEGTASEEETETIISSHDAGLLRRRASVQLKLQTRADAQRGDSGAALIDQNGKVMAFAFERTEYGEYPEFVDWIWADNAMAALGLTPFTPD